MLHLIKIHTHTHTQYNNSLVSIDMASIFYSFVCLKQKNKIQSQHHSLLYLCTVCVCLCMSDQREQKQQSSGKQVGDRVKKTNCPPPPPPPSFYAHIGRANQIVRERFSFRCSRNHHHAHAVYNIHRTIFPLWVRHAGRSCDRFPP